MVDESMGSLNVAVMTRFIATSTALFAGLVAETIGAVVSVVLGVLEVVVFPLLPQAVSVIEIRHTKNMDDKGFFMAPPPGILLPPHKI